MNLLSCLLLSGLSLTYGWQMTPVKSIQARVDSNPPLWDEQNKMYVSPYGSTFDQKFYGTLDSVNTATVEGALMYVQAEGINKSQQENCSRKGGVMKYVIFYEITMVQTNYSLAQYAGVGDTIEYCPMLAMDSGRCTPDNGNDIPVACQLLYGGNGSYPDIGPCIGGTSKETDPRAPYAGNYWFSYPGNCVMEPRAKKTPACSSKYPTGMCAPGIKPDGINCTWTQNILGYVSIDDVVGITKMNSSITEKPYKDFNEFCNDLNGTYEGIEFLSDVASNGSYEYIQSIPFWDNPYDIEANANRSTQLVKVYNEVAKNGGYGKGNMTALPSLTALAKANPPCYKNAKECDTGCKRTLYAQICVACSPGNDTDCVAKPSSAASVPTLAKAVGKISVSDAEAGASNSTKGAKGKNSTSTPKSGSTSGSSTIGVVTSLVIVGFLSFVMIM